MRLIGLPTRLSLWRSYTKEACCIWKSNANLPKMTIGCRCATRRPTEDLALLTTTVGLLAQPRRAGWMPTRGASLAVVLGALVLLSVAVNTFVIVAHCALRAPGVGGQPSLAHQRGD